MMEGRSGGLVRTEIGEGRNTIVTSAVRVKVVFQVALTCRKERINR